MGISQARPPPTDDRLFRQTEPREDAGEEGISSMLFPLAPAIWLDGTNRAPMESNKLDASAGWERCLDEHVDGIPSSAWELGITTASQKGMSASHGTERALAKPPFIGPELDYVASRAVAVWAPSYQYSTRTLSTSVPFNLWRREWRGRTRLTNS